MATKPLVSVCMATYQHEKYVGEAVRSVLAQSIDDFELVIINDGSTDATADRIAEFDDPRIRLINQANQGPAVATNNAIAAAQGKYIALFSGDDVCHPDRLRVQLEACVQSPRRIVFSGVDFIDDEGRPIVGDHFASTWFDAGELNRAQIMARLFDHGNFLNGVTTFGEREVFAAAPYDPTLLQLQDFDLWVRLIRSCDIVVLPDQLVHYRIRCGGANLSAPNAGAIIRCSNEHYLILRRLFDDMPPALFREAFADSIIQADFNDGIEFEIEKAMLYSRARLAMARAIGFERLHDLLNDKVGAAVLARRYDFTSAKFFDLMRDFDVFNVLGSYRSTVFFDTGVGFNGEQQVNVPIHVVPGGIRLQFEIPATTNLVGMRWDPVEGRSCRVRLQAIECTDADGQAHAVDFHALTSNGWAMSPGTFEFENHDPMIFWPISGDIRRVAIRGNWELDTLPGTVDKLRQQILRLQAELAVARQSATNRILKFAKRTAKRLKAG